jgi:hypothetical protein
MKASLVVEQPLKQLHCLGRFLRMDIQALQWGERGMAGEMGDDDSNLAISCSVASVTYTGW